MWESFLDSNIPSRPHSRTDFPQSVDFRSFYGGYLNDEPLGDPPNREPPASSRNSSAGDSELDSDAEKDEDIVTAARWEVAVAVNDGALPFANHEQEDETVAAKGIVDDNNLLIPAGHGTPFITGRAHTDVGSGSAPPLVYHGFNHNGESFDPLIRWPPV
jgi:hypothetical protein